MIYSKFNQSEFEVSEKIQNQLHTSKRKSIVSSIKPKFDNQFLAYLRVLYFLFCELFFGFVRTISGLQLVNPQRNCSQILA